MTHVHRVTRRATTSVEVERLASFVAVQDVVELTQRSAARLLQMIHSPMREECTTTEHDVGLASSQLLEPGEKLRRDASAAELINELVVVTEL